MWHLTSVSMTRMWFVNHIVLVNEQILHPASGKLFVSFYNFIKSNHLEYMGAVHNSWLLHGSFMNIFMYVHFLE